MRLTFLFASICAGLAVVLMTYSSRQASANSLKDVRTQQYLGNQFRCGFYYYKVSSSRLYSDVTLQEVEQDINRIADLGFNYVYVKVDLVPNVSEYSRFERLLQTCVKRQMAVGILLSGAASLPQALAGRHTDQWKKGWSAERLVENVTPFIKKYINHPNIVDFAVLEEPDEEALPRVTEYYKGILQIFPRISLSLLYNKLEVAVADKDNHFPVAIGHDNYPFKGKPLRTPAFALQLYASQVDAHQQLAERRGQAFEATFSGFTQQQKVGLKQGDATVKLAKSANQGYSIDDKGEIHYFSRYRPPENATTAMSWLALSKGADSVSVYSWSPSRVSDSRKIAFVLGLDNKGSRVLDEFAAFAKEIRPFGKLMRSVSRDITSFTLPKVGEIVPIAPPSNPVLQVTGKDIVWDSFSVPNYEGKMIVVVNTNIGSWSNGKSPLILKDTDAFHIDDNGDLTDFTPLTDKRDVETKVLLPHTEAVDLMTGEKIATDASGKMTLKIAPGSGIIVFLSPKGSNEAQKLMKDFELPGK